ncbi:NADPH:quinone reductase [Ramlibacter sp. PS3R-8]|uniref:NADPH:quinone reductase n=1 Tax=Ramlibacter sp. PS3R-8 TaxID=3133437 RepID=UPI00309ABC77
MTMRAAYYEKVGPARDVLHVGEVPTPEPAAGEVRVRVRWSGVNPSDVKSRSGLRHRTLAFPRVIPHSDGSGVIDRVGAGIDRSRIGERVWLWNAAWGRAFGTAAEYVCLPSRMAVKLPEGVDEVVGACLGIPALTAMHAVLMDGGVAGKTVLVSGGAGAVGHYAIQLAGRLGAARVISTVSGPVKAALAAAAGADDVINYKTEDVVQRVRDITSGAGVDRAIEMDVAVNGAQDLELLRIGGDCVAYGSSPAPLNLAFPTLLAKNIQLRFFMVYHLADADRERAIATLHRMLKLGALTHNIGERMPLADIVEAHEKVEQGKVAGNLVLAV